ncbi:MAG TPA: hypothetical protein H9851_00910 [Candidatus Borkfalkia faecavium]|uniref:Uncharacterized protein n=1 Tax=Candidatus Borkfalkia faecavium TaxID=2838508 RepID=A0A9D1VZS1_9FIRM|nr:hypothetical protein [Candidatus Borkfalkia faecavium]
MRVNLCISADMRDLYTLAYMFMIMISYPARSFNTFSKIVKKIFLTWVKRRTQLKSALKFLPSFQVSANFLKEKNHMPTEKFSKSIIKNFSRATRG